MADSLERLVLEILLKDRASDGLGRTSKAAATAAGSVDGLNKQLEETGKKTARARVELAGDKEAQAALDRIDVKLLSLDRRTASPNLRVEGAVRAQAELSALSLELDKLGSKSETATASVGTAGLAGPSGLGALIVAGVVLSPIIATVGIGVAGLGIAAYGAIAPIEAAAKKTGGLSANLNTLNAEQRGVALGILALGKTYDQFQKALQPEVLAIFGGGLTIARDLLKDIEPVAASTGKALGGVLGEIDAAFRSGTWQQFFGFMAKNAGPDVQQLGTLFVDLMNDLPPLLTMLQPIATGFLHIADATARAAGGAANFLKSLQSQTGAAGGNDAWDKIVTFVHWGEKHIPAGNKNIFGMSLAADAAGKSVEGMGLKAQAAAPHVYSLAQQVAGLTAKENAAISPMLAYSNSLISQRNDADALNKALKASHDVVGLKTAAERASFSAANTYIQDLLNTAAAATASHHGIDTQIGSIRSALPLLEHVKGGTRDYWQQVQALVGWLHRLEAQKNIAEQIKISGSGQWAVQGGGHFTAARGAYITAGTSPTADDVLVRASRGELVVPAAMVSAGAVDHLRGQIPGFAAGGIIPSYAGPVKGLQPWGQHNWAATISAITAGIAGALSGQLTAGGGGPLSASAAAAQAFARGMLGAYGWGGAQWPPLQALWQRESGWNSYAVNPSSGAYGIPQSLGHGHPYNLGDYQAQVRWGLAYIFARYGSPGAAWGHELSSGWYDRGGYLPPGLSLAYNGTGRPERVGGGNVYITVNVGGGVVNARETGRQIAGYLGEHIKGGGRIYPAGVTPR